MIEFEDLDEAAEAFAQIEAELDVTRKALLETLRIVRREHESDFVMLVRNLRGLHGTFERMNDDARIEAMDDLLIEMQVRSIK